MAYVSFCGIRSGEIQDEQPLSFQKKWISRFDYQETIEEGNQTNSGYVVNWAKSESFNPLGYIFLKDNIPVYWQIEKLYLTGITYSFWFKNGDVYEKSCV